MSLHAPKATMSTSPTKQLLAPPHITTLEAPPSPRTHRALRRLQSSITLGQSHGQPSLISQQHKAIQGTNSPLNSKAPAHNRGRSNSDATNMTPPILASAGRRPMPGKRSLAANALSLDRLIRDGPPDGDLIGGLEATRLKILDQGIKSDNDGMVRAWDPICTLPNQLTVILTNIRLAHSSQCPCPRN